MKSNKPPLDGIVAVRTDAASRKARRADPRPWAGWLTLVLLAWFSFLMLRITLQYIPIRTDVAFLQIKQQYLSHDVWKAAFFVHVFTSMFALAAGFTQFAPDILRRRPQIHRWMGRLYVLDVALVTGPAGLIMARFANGGLSSRIAFGVLAVLWIATTAIAWRCVMRRDFVSHREWMIRSYALTISAVTLRLWKLVLALALAPNPMDLYRVVAWLGWVPNILIAEWMIRRMRRGRAGRLGRI